MKRPIYTADRMLEAGLNIIIKEGWPAVSVERVAEFMGSSTRPLSFRYAGIENYKADLQQYALSFASARMQGEGKDVLADCLRSADEYINMAIELPNLVRFLRDVAQIKQGGAGVRLLHEKVDWLDAAAAAAVQYDISEMQAKEYLTYYNILTEGIVSGVLSGVLSANKETARQMLKQGSDAYLVYLKKLKSVV